MADAYRSEESVMLATTGPAASSSYIDWPAIFAGTLLATAVSFVLNTFGAAIGLSVVSPFDRDGVGGTGMLIAVALWVMWVTVSSFMAGAYVAGRMRRRALDASEHESDVRDGVHGLTVWALGILISAVVFASGVGTAVRAGADAVSGAAESASAAAGSEETYDYAVGRLLRGAEGAAPQTTENRRALLAEITGILSATAARGDAEIAADDKAYMTSAVAAETGLDEQQAAARVDELASGYRETMVAAKEAAETARVASVLAAFVLAASLLIAGAGAWWAAGVGGNHRDEETVLGFFGRRG